MKTSELSAHERALIDFEREWWQLGLAQGCRDPRSLRHVGEQLLPRAARASSIGPRRWSTTRSRSCACASGASRPTRPHRGSSRRSRIPVTARGTASGQNGDMNRPSGGNGEIARGASAAAVKGAALIGLAVIVGVFLLQRVDTSNAGSRGSTPVDTVKTTTTVKHTDTSTHHDEPCPRPRPRPPTS